MSLSCVIENDGAELFSVDATIFMEHTGSEVFLHSAPSSSAWLHDWNKTFRYSGMKRKYNGRPTFPCNSISINYNTAGPWQLQWHGTFTGGYSSCYPHQKHLQQNKIRTISFFTHSGCTNLLFVSTRGPLLVSLQSCGYHFAPVFFPVTSRVSLGSRDASDLALYGLDYINLINKIVIINNEKGSFGWVVWEGMDGVGMQQIDYKS